MSDFLLQYGVPGLFLFSFLAATILPGSSELALAGALLAGMPVTEALLSASLGNCLGCYLNYGMGFLLRGSILRRIRHSHGGRVAYSWTRRLRLPALFLSWLPIVGDPITIIAGVLRVRLLYFIPIVSLVRSGRYVVVIWGVI